MRAEAGRAAMKAVLSALAAGGVWTLTLWASRRFHAALPAVEALVSLLAVGGPGLAVGAILARRPPRSAYAVCAAAYLLGSAASTVVLADQGSAAILSLRELWTIGAVHLFSLSVLVLSDQGGFVTYWSNILWLLLALAACSVGLELRGRTPGDRPRIDRHPRRRGRSNRTTRGDGD